MFKSLILSLFLVSPAVFAKPVKIVETKQAFVELQKVKGYQIIMLEADWCPYCKTFFPVFMKASEEFSDTQFISVDIDKIGMRTSVPTTLIIKDGVVLEVIGGAAPYKYVEKVLKKHLGEGV